MKLINDFIIEKLIINSKIKINDGNSELEDILKHFEFDDLYEIDKGHMMEKPYITKEEGEKIKKQLLEFIKEQNCKKENFKYYTNSGRKFKDKKINKDYKKDNSILMSINDYAAQDIFFKGDYGLKFKTDPENKTIIMSGPLGGMKICCYKENQ